MRAGILAAPFLALHALADDASFADISAYNISAANHFAAMDMATLNLARDEEPCYTDYPDECDCYYDGQLWCSPPENNNMKDYKNECEAIRHVLDIIYTLCTLSPEKYHRKYSWLWKRVQPGENIYMCWPMQMTPARSSPYQ